MVKAKCILNDDDDDICGGGGGGGGGRGGNGDSSTFGYDLHTFLTLNNCFFFYIDINTACERVSPEAKNDARRLPTRVIDVMKRNYEENSGIKWQYFGNEGGVFTIYPANSRSACDDYDSRYRPWYVETATPEPKNVVIVIDKSSSMSTEHEGRTLMQIAKEAAITVVETMNPNDKVSLYRTTSSTYASHLSSPDMTSLIIRWNVAGEFFIPRHHLVPEQSVWCNKGRYFMSTVRQRDLPKSLHGMASGNRVDVHIIVNMYSFPDLVFDHVILFLTDGHPEDAVADSLSESEKEAQRRHDIMDTIKTRNAQMGNKVIILTFGLGNQLDEELLEAMAKQDGTDFDIPRNTSAGEIKVGRFTKVTNPNNLRAEMASYYNFFSTGVITDKPVFSVPHQAASGIGLITTVALPILEGGKLEGVVGVAITLQDLFADVTNFQEGQSTYSFIYEVKSKAMEKCRLTANEKGHANQEFSQLTTPSQSEEYGAQDELGFGKRESVLRGESTQKKEVFVTKLK
ncbi:VWFA and cache domain-containing protein 1-like [Ptychodera flava]|uniref:VWFA and cache domain-containing protein 1-like n=1 Tax=Ptychodera flava TaxID=63121 RepID=UPI00396A20E0